MTVIAAGSSLLDGIGHSASTGAAMPAVATKGTANEIKTTNMNRIKPILHINFSTVTFSILYSRKVIQGKRVIFSQVGSPQVV
jgi:hypothetical protein